MKNGVVLEVNNLSKYYKKNQYEVRALKEISFEINHSEIFGMVGESGSGKSTVAKLVTRLENPDEGRIILCDKDITHLKGKNLLNVYKDVQMVFQDSRASFNRRMTIKDSILESYSNLASNKSSINIKELLKMVELKEEYAERYPHELSGGECQRAAIARAIAIHPRLLICDEATSALDVSAQAHVVNLLMDLNKRLNMAILFISHDLALVSSMCDKTCVLYMGEIVEVGNTHEIIHNPKADYTKKLLSSVMTLE